MNGATFNRSTGHCPTALPFLDHLDSNGFEQFCTDLLNLNPVVPCWREGRTVYRRILSAQRLGGGTAQGGIDIRAEADAGEVWAVQCKRVKRFVPADVTEAMNLAEKGVPHADQYLLIATCVLSDKAQAKLRGRPKWMWWDPSRLTTEVQRLNPRENGMNLVVRHFGREWVKRLFAWGEQPLLTWQEFFAGDLGSDRRFFHHRTHFLAWGSALDRLESFACEGAGRALILSAAGGQGKSRLLLELAQGLEGRRGAPRVRFLNLSLRGLSEEDADLCSRERDLVLVVDDAHRLGDVVGEVARATAKAKSLRLLIATRPQAVEAVRSQLYRHGYAERLDEVLRLPEWKARELQTLAEAILNPAYRSQAPFLVRLADRCPLLVVLGGALINAGKFPESVIGEEDFRERVFKGFKDDFLRLQPEPNRPRVDRLIRLLSFVSPTPTSETLRTHAAKILDCSLLDVADDLKALLAAGLLVESREGVRLYPDLFADAVLLDACVDSGGRPSHLHRAVVAELPLDAYPSLLRNLALVDWQVRARPTATRSLFDPVWSDFERRFEKASRLAREEMLGHWAAFSVYLPERTLELAELALRLAEELHPREPKAAHAWTNPAGSVGDALAAILKPVVIWHPSHANRALELLWTLDAGGPEPNGAHPSAAIAAIADAASYGFDRPLGASRSVVDWLWSKVREPGAQERFRREPWLVGALLKPFFGREVERSWSTEDKVHISTVLVSAERTCGLRQKALAIAEGFLTCPEPALVGAVVPVFGKAVQPLDRKFYFKPLLEDHEVWRPERHAALSAVERAVHAHRESPAVLIQLRRMLRDRCALDPDPEVLNECRRVFAYIPDTFEMRVAIALTSSAHEENLGKAGSHAATDFPTMERGWITYCRGVAREAAERFPTAAMLCRFIHGLAHQLDVAQVAVFSGTLLGEIAKQSDLWCRDLLDELLQTAERGLDDALSVVLERAAAHAPETYRQAITVLPLRGRPEQLRAMIFFLGLKQVNGGGLDAFERQAVLQATERTEDTVVSALAWVAGTRFRASAAWALDVLSSLRPKGSRSASEVLAALAGLVDICGVALEPTKVAACLDRLGEHVLDDADGRHRSLAIVAKAFPKVVYEHLCRLIDSPGSARACAGIRLTYEQCFPLGRLNDDGYLALQVREQWDRLLRDEGHRAPRLALLRSLLQSDPEKAPARLEEFIAGCSDGGTLTLAVELAAIQGSRFVFAQPNLVRLLLDRASAFGVSGEIRESLWRSALGGPREFTEGELDPEYRYILEQAEDLANRYQDDPNLGRFYRWIADSERNQVELTRRGFDALHE